MAAALFAAGAVAFGCAPRIAAPPRTTHSEASLAAAVRCERALGELDALIATRSADAAFSAERLLEARALRGAAFELYVTTEYDIAFGLVEEAMTLLRNPS